MTRSFHGLPLALLLVLAWLTGCSLVTWAIYRLDKARARRGGRARRVPERVLLGLAAAGGSPGALVAVYAHHQRHKAQKWPFVWRLWVIVVAQLAAGGLAVYFIRR